MARPSFSADLQVRQQFLHLVHIKIPGEASWTLLDQGETVTPAQTAEQREYSRIGDVNVTRVPGQVTTDVTFRLYWENDLEELAHALGQKMPGGGWAGTEVIKLDPSKVIDIKIENYDGVTAAAALLSVEYINAFRPAGLTSALEAAGEARIADISGSAASYYIIPQAGLGA